MRRRQFHCRLGRLHAAAFGPRIHLHQDAYRATVFARHLRDPHRPYHTESTATVIVAMRVRAIKRCTLGGPRC